MRGVVTHGKLEDPHICEEGCSIKHICNCPECFGFGFCAQPGPVAVITAGQATLWAEDGVRPRGNLLLMRCQVCGSGIEGAATLPLPN